MANISIEEKMVLQEIRGKGSSGIWTRDLKRSTGLAQPALLKVLRQLESRGLVKRIRHVAHKTKPFYFAAEVVPSREVTGGAWFSDGEFDEAFVSAMRVSILQLFRTVSPEMTIAEVHDKLRAAELSKVELSLKEVQQLLMTMVYEHTLFHDVDIGKFCLTNYADPPVPSLAATPCGVCPVRNVCSNDSNITPAGCTYYDDFLGSIEWSAAIASVTASTTAHTSDLERAHRQYQRKTRLKPRAPTVQTDKVVKKKAGLAKKRR